MNQPKEDFKFGDLHIIIEGPAGSGKSLLRDQILRWLMSKEEQDRIYRARTFKVRNMFKEDTK